MRDTPAPGRLRAGWERLGPGGQRFALLATAVLGVLALATAVLTLDPGPESPGGRRQKLLHNILTDADPRALGLEGLAEQVRRLEERTDRLVGSVERLATEDRSTPQPTRGSAPGPTEEVRQSVRALSAEVERLRSELERGRETPATPVREPATPAPPASRGASSASPPDRDRLFESAATVRPVAPATGVGVVGTQPSPIRVIDASTGRPGDAPADRPASEADSLFVPAGSILKGVLLTGLDAPTGRSARRDPYPALLRVKHEAILPNRFRANVRECFVVAAGFGDLSAERAYLRGETLSCVRTDGGVIEVRIDGYAVGEDGKLGVRGRLVSKQGQVLAGALAAGFLQGFGSAFQQVPVPVIASGGDRVPYQQAFSAEALQGAALSGAGRAMERLAEFYLDMAEEMFPVIEVDAGRPVEFVLNRGAALKLAHRP
jgi:conjugal transfer pilus assembly protein TraB